MNPFALRAFFPAVSMLALCAAASSGACSSTGDGTSSTKDCNDSFYVEADASGRKPGPLPNEECPGLCGKQVFSCSVTSAEGGTANIECIQDCASTVETSAR
jgi:hypothetical protein